MMTGVKTEIDIAGEPGPQWMPQGNTGEWPVNSITMTMPPCESDTWRPPAAISASMKSEQTGCGQLIKMEPADDHCATTCDLFHPFQSPDRSDTGGASFSANMDNFGIKPTAVNFFRNVIKSEPATSVASCNEQTEVITRTPNVGCDMQTLPLVKESSSSLHTEMVAVDVEGDVRSEAETNIMIMTDGAARLEPAFSDDENQDRSSADDGEQMPELPQSTKEAAQDCSSALTAHPPLSNTLPSPPSVSTYSCQSCSVTFTLFSTFHLHMVSCHGETPHDVFPTFSASERCCSSIIRHKNSATKKVENAGNKASGGERKVEFADENNKTSKENRGKRKVSVVEKPLTCESCGKGYTSPGYFEKHQQTHSEEKSFVCDICGATFTKKFGLSRHQIVHTGEKPYTCDICGTAFSYKHLLKTHRRTHTGEKPYTCDICGAAFCQSNELKTHKRFHTGEKPYICHFCGASFCQSSVLKKHQRQHTGEKPYKCEICGTAFSHSTTLKVHKRTHTGEKPYKCEICGVAFSACNVLQIHKRYHTGEKPYICDMCGMAFSESNKLKRHKRTHTGEKPYKCADCEKGFATPATLRDHRLLHTGEKPHACLHCPAAFTRARSLKRHLEKCHR